MDYNDPSRRQYVQNSYSTQQQAQSGAPATGSYSSTPTDGRIRQSSYIQHSPTSAAPSGRASSDQVYGFAGSQYGTASSASAQALQYTGDLQTPDVARQQDTPQYGSSLLYQWSQQGASATQSPYDSVSRYTQRHGTAAETLASQFGSSQTAQYYLAGQPASISATLPDLAAPHLPSQYQTAYAQAGPSSQTYANTIMDPTQSSAYSTYPTQYAQPSASQSADQQFSNYKAQLRTIFFHVREGSLRDIGSMLMEVSHYLLSNVEALGLTRDDDVLHDERVKMWDEFNRAWLATLQAQFDMTQEYLRTRQLRESTSLMNQQTLETLSRELVRLCDSIEKHGLVDYQMGVAEEEIMDLLIRCLNQLDPENASNPEDSSSSAPR